MNNSMKLAETEFKAIQVSLDGGIAHLRFVQPDKANAMTRNFWHEFPLALAALDQDQGTRVLIISGDGKHFSSGMDLSIFSSNSSLNNTTARERQRLRKLVVDLQEMFSQLERLRFPTIAAVQGACIGAGLDLVSACDMRYATKSAYFCVHEVNLAMMADLGVLQRLPKLVPDGIVRELAFTGDRLSAERALQIGLINAVFETEEQMLNELRSVAGKIAAKSPLAIASSKESLNFARDNGVQASLAHAAILQSSILDIQDLAGAAASAAQKSEAVFAPLLKSGSL